MMNEQRLAGFNKNREAVLGLLCQAVVDAGIWKARNLRLATGDGMIFICPGEMTAMDIVRCLNSMDNFAKDILGCLQKECDVCDDCGNCNYRDGDYFKKVRVSPHLLRQAGIPMNAKLCAEVDAEEGKITITASAATNDLSDIPVAVQDILMASDICFDGLEQSLAEGDVIYGTE